MGRIIIFTGKGGVGKSSVAAAHAIASAKEGKKTLLVSADMAHNLGDLFEIVLDSHIHTVKENLDLLELDPELILEEDFPNFNHAVSSLLGSAASGLEKMGDNYMIPGFENLFSLMKIKRIYESGDYDRILVDCAPTGETLSLLKLPEMLTWYMEKFFPVGKAMVRVLSPISKIKYKVDLPTGQAMDDISLMHKEMVMLQELLKNPEVSSVRLVCLPEKMVVEETKRNFMYLNLYDYQVDQVFINRVLPENTGSGFMDHWREIQEKYIEELEHVFKEIPMKKIPWYPEEIRGEEAILCLAKEIEQESLFDIRVKTERESYEAIEGGYRLFLQLPGAKEEEVSVRIHDMDIDIKVGNYDRCIPMPNTLRGAQIAKIKIKDEALFIDLKVKEREMAVRKDG